MPFFEPSRNHQLVSTLFFIIFGVIKINNSVLTLLIVEFVNRKPMPGKSAKKGILFLPELFWFS